MKIINITLIFFTVLFFVFSSIYSYSCGNEYEEDFTQLNGSYQKKKAEFDHSNYYYFNHGFDKQALQARKAGLEIRLKESPFYKTTSDYALVLLKLGEYKNGLMILEDLVKRYPKEYNIVVNLGTAYELNGKPELALKYITQAVKINPGSHEGSEWIHIEILKAMIKMKKDKDYLAIHSILNLKFPSNLTSYYRRLSEEDVKRLISIRKHLVWQLKERIAFVAPPNPVVADLLFDLANLTALTESIERSIPVYDQSLKYMPAKFNVVMDRRDDLKEKLYWTNFRKYSFVISSVMVFMIVLVLIIRRLRRRKVNIMVQNKANVNE